MQEKHLTKFKTHLWKKKKNSPESGHRGNLPQHNKGHIWQSHSKHSQTWWKTDSISLISGTREGCSLLPLSFNIVLEVLVTAIREEIKGTQIEKGVKLLLFADDMILYIKNPKDATRKLLELINEFSKVTVYKMSIHKSLIH